MPDFFEFQASLRKPAAAARAPTDPARAESALSVTELTEKIRRVLTSGLPGSVLVRGEISNYRPNQASGHLYLTLKDAGACINCVMFRSDASRLRFEPEDGLEVLAGGKVSVYAAQGRYQLQLSSLQPLGKGALELKFQQVRRKLEAEGLFRPERRKPLPMYPRRVVIVTSREAAALQDVLKVLRRFPSLQLMLYPVPVQGEGASTRIAAALAHINQTLGAEGGADVILLGRGGGSLEDLWNFNEESVARAIAASRIPVVTGIGHEVDVSIADLVADYHAHTPTEAAQVITAQWRGAGELLRDRMGRLTRGLQGVLADVRQRLRSIERHEVFRRPTDRINLLKQQLDDRQRALEIAEDRLLRSRQDRVARAAARLERFLPGVMARLKEMLNLRRRQLDQRLLGLMRKAQQRVAVDATRLQERHPRLRIRLTFQRLDAARDRLNRGMGQAVHSRVQNLEAISRQLEAVSPQSVLRRGYSITTRKKDGVPLRSAEGLKAGDKLVTRFADGQVESTVNDARQMSLFE